MNLDQWPRDCWSAAILAGVWCFGNWLMGDATSVREFAIWMAAWGTVVWCLLAARDYWRARQERRRIELLRELSVVDQDALAKRYEELTGHPWPYRQ